MKRNWKTIAELCREIGDEEAAQIAERIHNALIKIYGEHYFIGGTSNLIDSLIIELRMIR